MAVSSEQQRYMMLNEPAGRLLLKKSVPMVITQLITVIYNTADTFFVAKINTQASAAVGIVFSLMAIIQAVGFGIGMGAGSLISRCLGAAKDDEANSYANSGLIFGFSFGCVILLLGMIFLMPFMSLLGASASILPYAVEYARYILIAAPFMCLSFVLNNALRAGGQTILAMAGMASGGILNMILDPLMIFTLDMGIKGAAVSTMAGQILSLCILGSFFVSHKSIVRINPKYISKNIKVYLTILKTGLPTIFRQGLASLSTALLNNQAVVYGDAAVAAVSIANKIYMLSRNIVLGIGQGYQPIAGYCFGAGKRKRVRSVFWLSCLAGTIAVLAIAVFVFVFRNGVITWFRDDPEVIKVGTEYLVFACASMPFLAYSTFVNQTYQCLGFAGGATFLASCRQGIFFVPLAFILPALLGLTGIELLQPSADMMTFAISIPFQIMFFRKHLSSDK